MWYRFYIANRIGWDHVGLGSDFDGIASVISGLEDVRCYPALLQAILDRGATEEQLAKVSGQNMIRVWKGAVQVRDRMKEEGVLPVEDVWEGRTWWRYDGYCRFACCSLHIPTTDSARLDQMPDPDPEDKLGLDWYGVPPPETGLYHEK